MMKLEQARIPKVKKEKRIADREGGGERESQTSVQQVLISQ